MKELDALLKGANINKKKAIIYLILGLTLTITLYLTTPIFHVKNIVVLGNSKIKSEEIVSKLNILIDKNPYLIDKQRIKEIYN